MRRVILLIICLSLMLSPASAHSGGTDSKGGHYDHSTGDYHYHHGHPAHDHDGGVCPYDFDDQTGKNSGSSKTSGRSDSSNSNTTSSRKSAAEELWEIAKGLLMIPVSIVVFILILSVPYYLVELIKKSRKFRKEKAEYEKLYKEKNPINLVNKPQFTIIGADGLPRQTPSKEGWGEHYTVYVTEHGEAYHQRRGCCYSSKQMHIYHANQSRRPCKICCSSLPDLTWYVEYLRIKQIKEKYKID